MFDDLDPQLFECRQLKTDDRQIELFRYWHDRVVVLKQVSMRPRLEQLRNSGTTGETAYNGIRSGLRLWSLAWRCSLG